MKTGTGRIVDLSKNGIATVMLRTRAGITPLYGEVSMVGDALFAIFGDDATRATIVGQRVRYWRDGEQLMALGPVTS